MADNFSAEGFDEIFSWLEQNGVNLNKAENEALTKAAEPIANDARSFVNTSRYNEEHIKDDIEITKVKTSSGVKNISVQVGNKTSWRAKFVECGTSKMSPKPFLSKAADKNQENCINIIKNILSNYL